MTTKLQNRVNNFLKERFNKRGNTQAAVREAKEFLGTKSKAVVNAWAATQLSQKDVEEVGGSERINQFVERKSEQFEKANRLSAERNIERVTRQDVSVGVSGAMSVPNKKNIIPSQNNNPSPFELSGYGGRTNVDGTASFVRYDIPKREVKKQEFVSKDNFKTILPPSGRSRFQNIVSVAKNAFLVGIGARSDYDLTQRIQSDYGASNLETAAFTTGMLVSFGGLTKGAPKVVTGAKAVFNPITRTTSKLFSGGIGGKVAGTVLTVGGTITSAKGVEQVITSSNKNTRMFEQSTIESVRTAGLEGGRGEKVFGLITNPLVNTQDFEKSARIKALQLGFSGAQAEELVSAAKTKQTGIKAGDVTAFVVGNTLVESAGTGVFSRSFGGKTITSSFGNVFLRSATRFLPLGAIEGASITASTDLLRTGTTTPARVITGGALGSASAGLIGGTVFATGVRGSGKTSNALLNTAYLAEPAEALGDFLSTPASGLGLKSTRVKSLNSDFVTFDKTTITDTISTNKKSTPVSFRSTVVTAEGAFSRVNIPKKKSELPISDLNNDFASTNINDVNTRNLNFNGNNDVNTRNLNLNGKVVSVSKGDFDVSTDFFGKITSVRKSGVTTKESVFLQDKSTITTTKINTGILTPINTKTITSTTSPVNSRISSNVFTPTSTLTPSTSSNVFSFVNTPTTTTTSTTTSTFTNTNVFTPTLRKGIGVPPLPLFGGDNRGFRFGKTDTIKQSRLYQSSLGANVIGIRGEAKGLSLKSGLGVRGLI